MEESRIEPPSAPPPSRAQMNRRFLRTAATFYLLLMAIPLWWQAASEGPNLFYPGGFSLADTIGGLISGILAGLMVVAFSAFAMRRTEWGRTLARTFAEILGGFTSAQGWWLALLSGFGEEMFFRGLLQPHLGLVITSLIFGLVHLAPRRELLPWTIFSIGAGFLLGWLYQFAGNLVAPIACHVVVNGINLRGIARSAKVPPSL